MRKSAIYLGASAATLAIAGAFTTKGSTKVKLSIAFTRNDATFECKASHDALCTDIEKNNKTCFTNAHNLKLYSKDAVSGLCTHTLHTGLE